MGKNHLGEAIVNLVINDNIGKVLDLGCGDGRTGKMILDKGFSVQACDIDKERFEFQNTIPFNNSDLSEPLPYNNSSFDYVIFMEVIEHIYNPNYVISEISRILKPGGRLILSTPNILNIGSRFRFLFEGSFDFFREPPLDYSKNFPKAIQNMHVIPWRYQELEYLLYRNNLEVIDTHTDRLKMNFMPLKALLSPFMYLNGISKDFYSKNRESVSYSRINRIILSKEMLLGKHLIIKAIKK